MFLLPKEVMQVSGSAVFRHIVAGLFMLVIIVLNGCASNFVNIAPKLPDKYEKLGHAEGTGCGSLMIYATAYNFIPVLLNERVERAYQKALESVPGATALADVSMKEKWFWWVLGSTRCVTITGEAIR